MVTSVWRVVVCFRTRSTVWSRSTRWTSLWWRRWRSWGRRTEDWRPTTDRSVLHRLDLHLHTESEPEGEEELRERKSWERGRAEGEEELRERKSWDRTLTDCWGALQRLLLLRNSVRNWESNTFWLNEDTSSRPQQPPVPDSCFYSEETFCLKNKKIHIENKTVCRSLRQVKRGKNSSVN